MGARSGAAEHYPKTRIPGESRDPLFNGSVAGQMDPGFRRECGFSVGDAITQMHRIFDK